MMASSTTTPIAMARPPKVIVLNVTPRRVSTIAAAKSDSGMAAHETAAIRRSNRKRNITTVTKTAPNISDSPTLLVAVSMKFAGRNRSA
jgi:hypothetical protein